jgi:hypothetical protein
MQCDIYKSPATSVLEDAKKIFDWALSVFGSKGVQNPENGLNIPIIGHVSGLKLSFWLGRTLV